MDTLDYTGVWLGLGDPVRELPREFRPVVPLPSAVTDVRVFCGGCLVVGGPPAADDPGAAARLAAHPAFRGWPLLVLTAALVTRRWREYFPEGRVEMGDSERAHLDRR
jgi:4-hydroxybenzoate decarboxylase subunit C